jgi:flagellar motor switch protein FliM
MVLSDWLRTSCFVELQYIEEQTFFEYTNTLLNSSAIGIIDFQPLGGEMVLELSNIAANSMVNLIMGGSPEEGVVKQDFTEIELMLLRKALERFLPPLRNAWINYVELTPVLTRVETNGQRAQITGANEIVSMVTFKIAIGSEEGILNCCIPSALLDPINSKLDRKSRFSIVRTTTENNEEIIRENIRNIAVEVKCELGKSYLTWTKSTCSSRGT